MRRFVWFAALVCLVGPAAAQDKGWIGKRVLVKQPGIKIGYSDDNGQQVYVAELTGMAYPVIGDRDGFLKVEHRGHSGWFSKTEAMLPDQAAVYFAERVRIDANDLAALAFLGWAEFERKNYGVALGHYDALVRRQPKADWHNNRGLIRIAARDLDGALADFDQALKLAPTFLSAAENRAGALTASKKTEAAALAWTEVIRRDATNVRAYLERAELHAQLRDVDAAAAGFGKVLELEPKKATYWLRRGNFFADHHLHEKAVDDFDEAIKLDGKNPDAYYYRALVLSALKRPTKALADAEKALKLSPGFVEARIARGWNRMLLGQFAEADADFSAALSADGKNASAYNCRAWLWATASDKKFRDGAKAEGWARKAVVITEEKDAGYLDTLAATLAEQGKFKEPVLLQERVVADAAGDRDLLPQARARLELYRKNQPYRQPLLK